VRCAATRMPPSVSSRTSSSCRHCSSRLNRVNGCARCPGKA
jgi:hypothetical protein